MFQAKKSVGLRARHLPRMRHERILAFFLKKKRDEMISHKRDIRRNEATGGCARSWLPRSVLFPRVAHPDSKLPIHWRAPKEKPRPKQAAAAAPWTAKPEERDHRISMRRRDANAPPPQATRSPAARARHALRSPRGHGSPPTPPRHRVAKPSCHAIPRPQIFPHLFPLV